MVGTVTELNEAIKRDYETETIVTIGGRTFKTLYKVIDRFDLTVYGEGFTTKKAARDFAETVSGVWCILPYVNEI